MDLEDQAVAAELAYQPSLSQPKFTDYEYEDEVRMSATIFARFGALLVGTIFFCSSNVANAHLMPVGGGVL